MKYGLKYRINGRRFMICIYVIGQISL